MHSEKNPWIILDAKEMYENPWICVTEFSVINPSGGKGIYGKIHFKNLAIGIIPLDEDLNTYLVGQYRFPVEAYSWEIPEGGCPEGMDPEEGAKRELEEETGLIAGSLTRIQDLHLSNSVTDEYGIIFLARQLRQGVAAPEETEQLVVKKLPFEEVYRMVEEGRITDSLTVAAVLKVKLMLADGRIAR